MSATTVKIRQSFAAKFDQCPRSAKVEQGRVDQDTHQQARGTIFHEFARRLIQECIDTGERAAPPSYGKDLMIAVLSESGLPIGAREYDELEDMAGTFAATREFDIHRIVDMEETYTIEVGGATLTGRPDRLDVLGEEAWVYDYKTGWAIDPEAEMGGTFQGRLYGRMVFDAYPQVKQVHLVWDYPRWGANGERVTTLTRDDLAAIDAYLDALVARILHAYQTDTFAPSSGPWCYLCADPDGCPIPQEERGDGSIGSEEEAAQIAAATIVLDARLRRSRKALRPYVDTHGPILLDGVEFAFKLKADSQQCRDKDHLRTTLGHADTLIEGLAGALSEIEQGKAVDSDRLAELLTAAEARPPLAWEQHFKTVKGTAEFRARKAA